MLSSSKTARNERKTCTFCKCLIPRCVPILNANRFQDLHSEINMSTAFRRCFNLKPFGTMVSVWLRLLPQLLTSDKLAPEYMIRHGPTICHDHFANIPQRNVQINAQFEKRILKKLKPKKNSGSPSIRWLSFIVTKNEAQHDRSKGKR